MFDLVVILLFCFSLTFWAMGFGLLCSKKLQDKFESQIKAKDKKEYIKFNGKYNLVLGFITTALSVSAYFLPGYKVIISVVYVIFIFASASFQVKLAQKYM